MYKLKNAFTLMEVVVVILIISIIAAFSIPNYTKAVAKSDERNMITNLKVMRAAVELYTADGRNIGTWNDLGTINDNLGISVLDTKATYDCTNTGITNGCTATHVNGWELQFHAEHSNNLIHCSAGTCPSCPIQPGNCE